MSLVGGDFFAAVPEGGDAYLLKAVLHDWPDDECLAILRSCRRAMGPTGVVLVAPGGRERELAEYGALPAQEAWWTSSSSNAGPIPAPAGCRC